MRRGAREERRDDRQDDRGGPLGGGGGKNHYQMRQKMISIGDDFWIENDRGEKVFKVDGKALRVRQTLILEDARGQELYKIQERMLRVKDSMEVEDARGQRVAMVKKALITPIRERWTVNVKGGPDLEVQGNILDHEYTIGEGRDKIAEVSKKWFRLRDTYGVEIDPGQDDALILAVAVCIDEMAHPSAVTESSRSCRASVARSCGGGRVDGGSRLHALPRLFVCSQGCLRALDAAGESGRLQPQHKEQAPP